MTAKEYLREYRRMAVRVNQIDEEIKRLGAERDSITVKADGMPSGSGLSDRVARLAVKIADKEKEYMGLREELLQKRSEVVETILSVSDDKQSQLLYLRYARGMKWEDIADEMGYYLRHIHRIHGHALLAVQKIIDNSPR